MLPRFDFLVYIERRFDECRLKAVFFNVEAQYR